MAAPSKIAAARDAVDRSIRTERMAQVMRDREAGDGACTFAHLTAAGFTEAEIEAYRDDARALLSGRPVPITLPAGRVEGLTLVAQARSLRARRLPAPA